GEHGGSIWARTTVARGKQGKRRRGAGQGTGQVAGGIDAPDEDARAADHLTWPTLRAACAFVKARHRHHPPPRGHKFSVAVEDDGEVVGVAGPSHGCPMTASHSK